MHAKPNYCFYGKRDRKTNLMHDTTVSILLSTLVKNLLLERQKFQNLFETFTVKFRNAAVTTTNRSCKKRNQFSIFSVLCYYCYYFLMYASLKLNISN